MRTKLDCARSGAAYNLCTVAGCKNKIQKAGLCCKHGAPVNRKRKADGEGVDGRVDERYDEDSD